MAVIGFNLRKILIERVNVISGKISIRTNINITDIKKEKIAIIKDQEVLSFNFEFNIHYDPEIASIGFEGNVLVTVEPKQIKEILNKWKKKEVSETIKVSLFNSILSRCNIKALVFEEEMSLPSHIPLPKFTKEMQSKGQNKK